MPTTTVERNVDQFRTLEELVAVDGESIPAVVQRAVRDYLDRIAFDRQPPMKRFAILAERIQRRIPADLTPDEIKHEITLAREVYRQERHAERGG